MSGLNPAQARECNCTGDDIYFVSVIDFNIPGMRGSQNIEILCRQLAAVNGLSPTKSCGLVILPDLAKASSLRGLYDEEKEIQEALFSLRQYSTATFASWSCALSHVPLCFLM